jgi:signal transduction histidine kinase
MSPTTRTLLLTLVLFGVFVTGALLLQGWQRREGQRLLDESAVLHRIQLERSLALLHPSGAAVIDSDLAALGIALGGELTLRPAASAAPPAPAGFVAIEAPLPARPDLLAHLVYSVPTQQRLALLHQRTLALIVILGLVLLSVPLLVGLLRRAPAESASSRPPWRQASAAMSGLTEMARLSNERGELLQRESGARQRAEESFQTSQALLGRSEDERIRLGRELHDNICQTLFAVSLTLESLVKKLPDDPATGKRMQQSIAELRRLNQEVRAYLKVLEPGAIQRQSFTDALAGMLGSLPSEGTGRVVSQIDGEVAALISSGQAVHVVSILREAVSNALRHGGAGHITLRAERDEQTVALAIVDDGAGFSPATPREGHGLANMQARARDLGATLRVDSQPGKGTRILLLLPISATA